MSAFFIHLQRPYGENLFFSGYRLPLAPFQVLLASYDLTASVVSYTFCPA